MRKGLVVLGLLLCSIAPAPAQVSVGIGTPYVSVGINVPTYPELVPVPGYPVYYAPRLNANYFFYDGMYWLFDGENWYSSIWYNGPWELCAPEFVPLFVLRVPVAYYRRPPVYFNVWGRNAPPHWGEHWGASWESRRSGWDRWDRASIPAPAPLPVYQRQYSGSRYPRVEQQQVLQTQNYRYQPRDTEVRQQYQARTAQVAPPHRVERDPQSGASGDCADAAATATAGNCAEPDAATAASGRDDSAAVPRGKRPASDAAAASNCRAVTTPPSREANVRHPTPPPQASVQRPVEPRQAAVQHPAPPPQAMVQHAPPQTNQTVQHAPPQTNQAAVHPAPPSKPTVAQNPAVVQHPPAVQQHPEPKPPQVAARAEHPMPKQNEEKGEGKGEEGKR